MKQSRNILYKDGNTMKRSYTINQGLSPHHAVVKTVRKHNKHFKVNQKSFLELLVDVVKDFLSFHWV